MASLSTCHVELVVWDGNLVKSNYGDHGLIWENREFMQNIHLEKWVMDYMGRS